jgi:hypothetical protein
VPGYLDAIDTVGRIAERYQHRADRAGTSPAARRDAALWAAQAQALRDAATELRDNDQDEDVADVPPAVLDLVGYLLNLDLDLPPHPLAGGGQGHCTPCRTVGHALAHPERDCQGVGCDGLHEYREDGRGQSPAPAPVFAVPGIGRPLVLHFDPTATLIHPFGG